MRFAKGAGFLFRGLRLWRERPRLMLLGIIPALIAMVIIVGLLVTLVVFADDVIAWATPFADDWGDGVRSFFRIAVLVGVLVGAGMLSMVMFTGLTLTVGDPFYEKIWKEVELSLGGEVPAKGVGWLRGAQSLGAIAMAFSLAHMRPMREAGAALAWRGPMVGNALLWILGPEIAQKVFRTSIHALEETLSILDAEAFERTVDLISRARQRDFYGIGGSAQIARDISHKFLRIGVRTSVFDDTHMMLMSAAMLGPDDAVMVGDTPWDIEAAERAGIACIAVMTGGFGGDELREAGQTGSIVSLLCDPGERYDRTLYDPQWLARNGLDPALAEVALRGVIASGDWRQMS